jgi:hypothetical protein
VRRSDCAPPVTETDDFMQLLVMTGEEDEETLHQVRGKLYSLVDTQWKERGTGTLKLNVRRSDGGGARLGECLLLDPVSLPSRITGH